MNTFKSLVAVAVAGLLWVSPAYSGTKLINLPSYGGAFSGPSTSTSSFTSTMSNPGTTGAFVYSGTQALGSYAFVSDGTPAAHTNASLTGAFVAAPAMSTVGHANGTYAALIPFPGGVHASGSNVVMAAVHANSTANVDYWLETPNVDISSAGAISGATSISASGAVGSTGGRINSGIASPLSGASNGAFFYNGAASDNINAIFSVASAPAAHTNASNHLIGLDFVPNLSANHSAAAVIAAVHMDGSYTGAGGVYAPIHPNGSATTTAMLYAQNADRLDYVAFTPNYSVTGLGYEIGNSAVYGGLHISGSTAITEALTGTTPVQIVDAQLVCAPNVSTYTTCDASGDNLDILLAGTYDIGFNMSFAVSAGTEVMTCAVYKEGVALDQVAFHRTASASYGVAGARSIVAVSANDTLTVRCNIADASTPNLLIEHMQMTAVRLGN